MNVFTQKLLDKSLDVLEALLYEEKDLSFNKHGDIHGAYGLYFAKTKILDPKYHRWLLDAFDQRIVGDYDVNSGLDDALVSEMIGHAREFLQAAKEYLDK